MAPSTRRPPGPRKATSRAETTPVLTRTPRPPGFARASTVSPRRGARSADASTGAAPVSTRRTARSPSRSTPAGLASARRPSAKVTTTCSPRTLWALVTHEPLPHDHTAAARAHPDYGRRSALGGIGHHPRKLFDHRASLPPAVSAGRLRRRPWPLTCYLQVTIDPMAPRPAGPSALPVPIPAATGLEAAMATVGDRWTLVVIEALLAGPRRFSDLQDAIPRVAPNVLTSRLRSLEEGGLVGRGALLGPSAPVGIPRDRGRSRARRCPASAEPMGGTPKRGRRRCAPPPLVRHRARDPWYCPTCAA